MDPVTLIALTASAGFVFNAFFLRKDKDGGSSLPEPRFQPKIYATKQRRREEALDKIEVLPEYELAERLVREGYPILIVTGGAGTGKSTFVRWLVERFDGRCLLGAPTGISAINIGAKTLHSLCQLPPGFLLQENIKMVPRNAAIQKAQLLVIDEISMVNANLLDAVSAFFRMNREADAATGKRRVFGGMSVILIGDLFQLPPVVGDRERPWFEQYYDSTQFYGAKSLRYGDKTEKTVPSYYAIELKKTFRQADQEFVDLLTNVREGHQLSETVAALNRLCSITQHPPKGAVWLSPRNVEVDTTNQRELSNLPGEESLFEGELDGTFKEDRLPSPLMLRLKEGAQVMFTQNDKDKRWVNGTLGTVEELYEDGIVVKLSESRLEVDLNRAKWEDYRYEWRPETKRIERIPTGSYKQFPLMLAWAMTIHKSQGKTIDKVHLDLGGGAFASGQTYVALSRCRSITGLSMSRPLALTDIRVDDHARSFYATLRALIEAVPPASMLAELDRMEAARKGGDELPF